MLDESILEKSNRMSTDELLHSSNGHVDRTVFVAMPIFWHVDPYTFQCLMKLQQELQTEGIHGSFMPHFGDSAVGRARNSLTRKFLESRCTHLLFIDSDLIFGGEQIKRILYHDEPIVGGVYVKKQEGQPQLVLNGTDEPCVMRDDKLLEVKYCGTGFLRIAREVFEKMIEIYGDEISYKCDHDKTTTEWDFWKMGVYEYPDGSKRWLSEDWYFCQRAKDLGYKIYADMAVLLKHSGHAVFPLSYQERQLFNHDHRIDNFECPDDCIPGMHEVFAGQYDFNINFSHPPKIVDVGANAGAFAVWADWRWSGARVTCYEPDTSIFEYLKRNCERIGANAINAAVGDTTMNRLFQCKGTRLGGSQYRSRAVLEESVPIKVVDPSELPECDLMKVDTEGAEHYIVERITNLPTYLIVEYHDASNKESVLQSLVGKMVLVGDRPDRRGHGVMAFKRLNLS